jgi:hypothetical protein
VTQLKLNVTLQVYDGRIVPAAVTVNILDALLEKTVDIVEFEFHDIVAVVVTSELTGNEYATPHESVTF